MGFPETLVPRAVFGYRPQGIGFVRNADFLLAKDAGESTVKKKYSSVLNVL